MATKDHTIIILGLVVTGAITATCTLLKFVDTFFVSGKITKMVV